MSVPPFTSYPQRVPQLFGREYLLPHIREALMQDGAVLLHGPAGVGKTALAQDVLHWLKNQGHTHIFWYSCTYDIEESDLVLSLSAWLWHQGEQSVWDMIQQSVIEGEIASQRHQGILYALLKCLRDISDPVLIIDDLQIAMSRHERQMLSFIHALVNQESLGALRIVLTSREMIQGIAIRSFPIRELDRAATRSMIDSMLKKHDQAPLSVDQVDHIFHATRGKPAYIDLLMLDINSIDWERLSAIHTMPRMEAYLIERVYNDLSKMQNTVLHAIDVLKDHATREMLCRMLELSLDVLQPITIQLARQGLVAVQSIEQDTTLYQDIQYTISASFGAFYRSSSTITQSDSRKMHEKAASLLTTIDPIAAYMHYSAAHKYEEAARVVVEYDQSWIVKRQLTQKLEALPDTIIQSFDDRLFRAAIYRCIGDSKAIPEEGGSARENYDTSFEMLLGIVGKVRMSIELKERIAFTYLLEDDFQNAFGVLDQCAPLIVDYNDPYAQALLLNRRATAVIDTQPLDTGAAIGLFRDALSLLEQITSDNDFHKAVRLKAQVMFNLGMALRENGDMVESKRLFDQSNAFYKRVNDEIHRVGPLTELGTRAWQFNANFASSLDSYYQALRFAHKYSLFLREADILVNMAIVHRYMKDLDQADTYFCRAYDIYDRRNDNLIDKALTLFYMAQLAIERAQDEPAQQYVTLLKVLIRNNDSLKDYIFVLGYLEAALMRLRGEYEGAAAHLQDAWKRYARCGTSEDKAWFREEQARVAVHIPKSTKSAVWYAQEAVEYAKASSVKPLINQLEDFVAELKRQQRDMAR